MGKLLVSLIFSLLSLSAHAGFFFDACRTLEQEKDLVTERTILRLIKQHLVHEHASMNKLSTLERHKYLVDFFHQLCKMPADHRSLIVKRKIEIHLVAGSIGQHPYVQTLQGAPHGHDTDWASLPAIAGVSPKAPTIVNVMSLYQGHSSKNLILHEQAHVLDLFFNGNDNTNFDISSAPKFKQIFADSPWDQLYTPSLIYYYKDYPEEHFAELYAHWYGDESDQAKIRALIPGVSEFFDSLL